MVLYVGREYTAPPKHPTRPNYRYRTGLMKVKRSHKPYLTKSAHPGLNFDFSYIA